MAVFNALYESKIKIEPDKGNWNDIQNNSHKSNLRSPYKEFTSAVNNNNNNNEKNHKIASMHK